MQLIRSAVIAFLIFAVPAKANSADYLGSFKEIIFAGLRHYNGQSYSERDAEEMILSYAKDRVLVIPMVTGISALPKFTGNVLDLHLTDCDSGGESMSLFYVAPYSGPKAEHLVCTFNDALTLGKKTATIDYSLSTTFNGRRLTIQGSGTYQASGMSRFGEGSESGRLDINIILDFDPSKTNLPFGDPHQLDDDCFVRNFYVGYEGTTSQRFTEYHKTVTTQHSRKVVSAPGSSCLTGPKRGP